MRLASKRPSTIPGSQLRAARNKFGWSLRNVEQQSMHIAAELKDRRFAVPYSRLNDIERNNTVPSIFRIYTLARIYRRDLRELLLWYGVPSR